MSTHEGKTSNHHLVFKPVNGYGKLGSSVLRDGKKAFISCAITTSWMEEMMTKFIVVNLDNHVLLERPCFRGDKESSRRW